MTDCPPDQTPVEAMIGGLTLLAIIGGCFLGVSYFDRQKAQHELKVCLVEGYQHQTEECRHLLAEEAVNQQEKAEWCGNHPSDWACK